MLTDLTKTAADVARRTRDCPVKIWGFGVGGALAGMIRAGSCLGDDGYVEWVTGLVAPALNAAPAPTDHLVPVEVLLALRSARPDLAAEVDAACSRWVECVLRAPRPWAGGPRVHRPDLEPWSSTIWVDCMHTDGPGLALLGHPSGAVAYVEEYAAVLQRPDGLFHHGYDVEMRRGNGVAWGRGQGWALLGLVDTLREVPDTGLAARLRRLVEALARHEDAGRWHTVVDDPASPVEHSVAAYVALGVRRAVAAGLIDDTYAALAGRAFDATVAALVDGGLPVSEATPVGDHTTYVGRAEGVFPWGQGPVLHALIDRIDDQIDVEGPA